MVMIHEYDKRELEAIEQAIYKWNSILLGYRPILDAINTCSLCRCFATCEDCPLAYIGERCGDYDSTWRELKVSILQRDIGEYVTLDQINSKDSKHLKYLVEGMLYNLEYCLNRFKTSHGERVVHYEERDISKDEESC